MTKTMVVMLGLLVASVSLAEDKKKAPAAASAGSAVLTAPSEMKWVDAPNVAPNTVKLATVEGNAETGPHHAYNKFPAGFSAPLHHHTADHFGTVVSGTVTLTPEGGTPKKLGPGGYWEFKGGKKHSTRCEPGAECILFIDARGKWDVVLAEPAAKPKDAAKK
jgi:quercetin dioxygenase-like cupin family protein